MASLLDYIPSGPGYLPKWQLFVAATALFNTVQNFMTIKLTSKIYNTVPPNAPVTALQARTFAVWTLLSTIVRGYSAYHIDEKPIYDMAMITYLVAFAHFSSEIFIFRTAKLTGPVMSTILVSTVSMTWMITQYDFYVKQS
ncbi:Erg28-like protein [Stereum hirsutum FP-91666 SS1]|uniref:Erg28-like protein n=1 Tax=Stereum hirsutum (strain FP-91666) TaxID=721885 RepID=UPI000440E4F6|nr:Erg28-like protein [Stereum hirsutum FP-91666 SS1]EIM91409.1 Erg28-like protein [Stereum hirsutum FP-91666 SS1]